MSNLDTLTGCLDEVETAWNERAAADRAFPQGFTFSRGQNSDLPEHESYPRIRWVYGQGLIAPPDGRFPGQLGRRTVRVEAHVWGVDLDAAEQSCLWLAAVIVAALSAGRAKVVGEDWTVGDGRTSEGEMVRLIAEITMPLFRLSTNGVPLGYVATRKEIDK